MSLWRTVTRGLRALTHRDAADRDATDEVSHYVELATAAHMARGLSPDAARRAAELEIGNSTVAREEVRAFGWENAVETFLGDVRFALRRLRTNPGFTAVGAITLSLGIGATTAVFSAVNPILLQPLPYPHAEQLVTLSDRRRRRQPSRRRPSARTSNCARGAGRSARSPRPTSGCRRSPRRASRSGSSGSRCP